MSESGNRRPGGSVPCESYDELPVILGKVDMLASYCRQVSLWPVGFGIACCAIEMMTTGMAHFDQDRFGVVFWASPRQADMMIVSGTVTRKMAPVIKRLYEQMPEPKWVLAMGACAIEGGPFKEGYAVVQGVDKLIPVDVYVPGCPPRPEALMHGFMALQKKIVGAARRRAGIEDE